MRTLRDLLRPLAGMLAELFKPLTALSAPRASNAPRIEFSYVIYWTKHVREWDSARRDAMRDALMRVLSRPGFEPNAYERRYSVPGLDDRTHSGASLVALRKVLAAFASDG